MSSTTTDATTTPTATATGTATTSTPDFNTTIDLMLFEGGALIHALGSNVQCQALANKIEQADRQGFGIGHISFSVALDPIEVGIALEAVSDTQSALGQSVASKLKTALNAKLAELGINTAPTSSSLGGLGSDSTETTTDSSASQSSDLGSTEDSDGEGLPADSSEDDSGAL